MPKTSNKSSSWGGRNNRGNNSSEDKHYFGHDDRVGRSDRGSHAGGSRPRVSFKTHRPNNREISRNMALSAFDEDVPMTGNSNNNARQVIINPRDKDKVHRTLWQRVIVRGRNSPLPNRNFKGGQPTGSRLAQPGVLPMGESCWYRIIIPYGHKYEKDYVLRALLAYIAPQVFVPITYKIIGNEASFYVDDYKMASALFNSSRKITMTDGFKLLVKVKPGFPQCEIDDKLKERLKQAMAKRYVQETNALDLSKFHQDPDLVADYFCALFRPTMLMTVLDIVAEHIPTLKALNLEGNKLQTIERLCTLNKLFPTLNILYIGDNRIKDIHQLDTIKDLKLEELRLTGNPLCNKYKSRQSDYISDVRKRFPKLLRLDGTELPRPIVFDVAEATKVPPSQRMFVTDAKVQEIASQFLQQYFTIFDSNNRQSLLNAYDEHACFSMTISTSHSNKLNGYLMENRNLFRMNDTLRRQKLLKQGKLPVVSFISELPQTRHFLNTFTMDIALASQTMMFVTITGYFQELGRSNKGEPIRHFNRTFVIIPQGSGYCIRNEQLHISQPSETQLKQLNQQLNSQQAQAEAPALVPQQTMSTTVMPTHVSTEANQPVLTEAVKQQMTVTLSQQTNMNLEWSLKCLQETQWNYDNALLAFRNFFERGQIPSEAFTK